MAKVYGKRKVVVIGDGRVGSSAVFALFQQSWVDEIGVIDVVLPGHKDKTSGDWVKGFNAMHTVEGDILDMEDGASLLDTPTKVVSAKWSDEPGKESVDYSICDDADVIIITSGGAQKPGQSRMELISMNAQIVHTIATQLKPHLNDHAVIVVVSNPCDVLTWVVWKTLGISSNRVIGSGCLLDSSRLRQEIGDELNISYKSVNVDVIGEHGDSEVAAFSVANVGGVPIKTYYERHTAYKGEALDKHLQEIHEKVCRAAYTVINLKKATNYAIALSITRITKAILTDEKAILPISVLANDKVIDGKVEGIYLSFPSILGVDGVEDILYPEYNEEDTQALLKSAETLKGHYASVKF